ncbi:MAG: NAD(P)H-dependent oxidoreductase [Chitinophagaceae bacterium]|nr:NAD(P)H-dependent oxidoreductase [Chitinophagaceae bacterium]
MKIAIILGSIRIGRKSHKIAYYLEKKIKQSGIDVTMIDLAEHPLPMMEEENGKISNRTGDISVIGAQLKEADAMILVSPEYHGSFSGVLKNALDFYWAEFNKKPIGVVTTGSGKMGGINASTQMQHVVLSLGAYPLPTKLLIPEIQYAFDDQFEPLREDIVRNSERFLNEFSWFANAIVNAKAELPQKAPLKS